MFWILNSFTISGARSSANPPLLSARLSIPSIKTRLLADVLPTALKLVWLKPEPLPLAEVSEFPEVLTMPGTNKASSLVRRRLSGRSTVCCSPISVPMLALLVLTSDASPLTSKVCLTCPTRSTTSIVDFWYTLRVMPEITVVLKPLFSVERV